KCYAEGGERLEKDSRKSCGHADDGRIIHEHRLYKFISYSANVAVLFKSIIFVIQSSSGIICRTRTTFRKKAWAALSIFFRNSESIYLSMKPRWSSDNRDDALFSWRFSS